MYSALHGSEGSEHKLQDYDTVQSSLRGQNFEGMYLYDKVWRNTIIPSSTLNTWHCVRSEHRYLSVHRYPSARIYCVIKQKPTILSITLCQMGICTPPAYLQTWQKDNTQLYWVLKHFFAPSCFSGALSEKYGRKGFFTKV